MKKYKLIGTLSVVVLILFSQCKKDEENKYPHQLRFITEDYKPFNYLEESKLTGLAPDLLKEICNKLNIPFEVEVLPWSEGYSAAQADDNAMLFSTILNEERRDLFKWAGPFASLDWSFYAEAQNVLSLASLDDAKNVGSIGVLQDYAIEQYLVQQGFTNLVYCNDHIDAFNRLLNGEIDLYPSDRIVTEASMNSMGHSYYSVKSILPIRTEMVYFAFNKNVPDEVVADFQNEIDMLKQNGFLKSLYQKYMHRSDHPGTMQIYTENYPPLSFMNQYGEISGLGSELVYEIMQRNNIFVDIKVTSWSNAYELALHNPNFCLFTMERTEIRENLFQWVGPIATNSTYFYVKAGSGIVINSLEDARNLNAIGTVNSWYSDQILRDLGFTNLVSDPDPFVMTIKLMQEEVDAFVISSMVFPDILLKEGYDYNDVHPAYTLIATDTYISFSKNTPVSTVDVWQSTLDAMKQDGTYDAIYKRWLPE